MSVVVSERSWLQRVVEKLLLWYSPTVEQARDEHTEAIRQRSISVRMKAEQVREAYKLSADRTRR